MPSVEDAIIEAFRSAFATRWRAMLDAAVVDVLADRLACRFDASTGSWSLTMDDIAVVDSADSRQSHLTGDGAAALASAAFARARTLSSEARTSFVAAINARVSPGGRQNWNGLKEKLRRAVPALLSDAAAMGAMRQPPVPALWIRLANVFAARASTIGVPKTQCEELAILHLSLLAGELRYTRQRTLRTVKHFVDERSAGLLGLRGGMVRLVEEVSSDGVVEPAPPAGERLKEFALPSPPTAWLSRLNVTIRCVARGRGAASRFHDARRPPTGLLPLGYPLTSFRASRRETYQLYDLVVLAYQLLSSLEQFVRGWASAAGVDVLTAYGRPKSIPDLVRGWAAADAIRDRLATIYAPSRPNVRSKLVHGGLLGVDTERQYLIQKSVAIAGVGKPPFYGIHPFSAENTCSLALDALRSASSAMRMSGLKPQAADFAWSAALLPTAAEIAADLPAARRRMTTAEAGRWGDACDLLSALMPGVNQFATIGLIGQIDPNQADALERYLAGLIVFESLYRLVLQMHGGRVLQVVPEGRAGDLGIRYQMLDEQQLLAADNLQKILGGIDPSRRAAAERWLLLSVRSRNAIVHGGVVDFSGELAEAMAYWLSRAVGALAESALHVMTRECAYFRHLSPLGASAAADWSFAEGRTRRLVRDRAANRRR